MKIRLNVHNVQVENYPCQRLIVMKLLMKKNYAYFILSDPNALNVNLVIPYNKIIF